MSLLHRNGSAPHMIGLLGGHIDIAVRSHVAGSSFKAAGAAGDGK